MKISKGKLIFIIIIILFIIDATIWINHNGWPYNTNPFEIGIHGFLVGIGIPVLIFICFLGLIYYIIENW